MLELILELKKLKTKFLVSDILFSYEDEVSQIRKPGVRMILSAMLKVLM